MDSAYCGRFAPSPTGALHFGSLMAALGSYLDARAHQGRWLLRIEDIDTPRNKRGAAEAILKTLDTFGFRWDGQVLLQSTRQDAYKAALEKLQQNGKLYACRCSRKSIWARSQRLAADGSPWYPGTCRYLAPADFSADKKTARRFIAEGEVCFSDRLEGVVQQNLQHEVGDFVLCRADGMVAYQLAVVVDDAFQGVTQVVRGADILPSTPRQIALQQALGLPTPAYAHLPIAVNAKGEKLSKQTRAQAIDTSQASPTLWQALRVLGQHLPEDLRRAPLDDIWQAALAGWNFDAIPRGRVLHLG